MSKIIEFVKTDKVELSVYECECGFHLGIDSTYLEQVEEIKINCPSCNIILETSEKDEEKYNE